MKFSQKLSTFIKDELWVLILDILAVNAAYFMVNKECPEEFELQAVTYGQE